MPQSSSLLGANASHREHEGETATNATLRHVRVSNIIDSNLSTRNCPETVTVTKVNYDQDELVEPF